MTHVMKLHVGNTSDKMIRISGVRNMLDEAGANSVAKVAQHIISVGKISNVVVYVSYAMFGSSGTSSLNGNL